jgi:hypothetical protein
MASGCQYRCEILEQPRYTRKVCNTARTDGEYSRLSPFISLILLDS